MNAAASNLFDENNWNNKIRRTICSRNFSSFLLDTSLTFTCQLLVKSVCVSSIKMNFALIYSIDVNDAVNIWPQLSCRDSKITICVLSYILTGYARPCFVTIYHCETNVTHTRTSSHWYNSADSSTHDISVTESRISFELSVPRSVYILY